MSAALRKSRLAFVDDLHSPSLEAGDINHFRRVLRMAPGDRLNISDGNGRWRPALLGDATSDLIVDGEIREPSVQRPQTTVAFAPTKQDRPEWTVQKLTELGVGRIVAIRTQRSVVKWDGSRAKKQVLKWRSVARGAAMQSRRLYLPTIEPQISVEDFMENEPSAVMCEPGGRSLDPAVDTVVAIGPEGGFVESELALAPNVDLSVNTILRAETAAMLVASRLVTHF